jgi:DNA-binding beta-propeller fold protein YncE
VILFLRRLVLLGGALAITAASLPSLASAADRVYWTNETNPGASVSFANLDGSGGGGDLNTVGATPLNIPRGVAIDPAAGRLYIANYNGNSISFANLDGSGGGDVNTGGATLSGPIGIAVDSGAGRVYWANSSGVISFANVDGSGGGDLNTAGATVKSPAGVALDPVGGRLYWSNRGIGGGISFANLDGSGGGDVTTTGATVVTPEGVALDPARERIYWANTSLSKKISFANLNGSGGGDLSTTGATVELPTGVAIDAVRGRILWGNAGLAAGISFANLDGSGGGGDLNLSGATVSDPVFPALLEAPRSVQPPLIGASSLEAGATLSCSKGTWTTDVPWSQLYRAPQTFAFQWSRDGQAIPGATNSSQVATTAGAYACTVTASNAAGASSKASPPVSVSPSNKFRFGKLVRNTRKGTAKLTVILPGPGALTLSGKGIVNQSPASARRVPVNPTGGTGNMKLLIKAKGKKREKLTETGEVKLKAKISFTPSGGTRNTKLRPVKLIRRR